MISANSTVPVPAGVEVVTVVDAAEMRSQVLARSDVDAVVMAAAVADYRPVEVAETKLKKESGSLTEIRVIENSDILADLVAARGDADTPVVVGFAAETGDETTDYLEYGRRKLARKGCDLLVVNEVGDGLAFEVDRNAATVIGRDGYELDIPMVSKRRLADSVWDAVLASGALK